jgi:hypothetical protein
LPPSIRLNPTPGCVEALHAVRHERAQGLDTLLVERVRLLAREGLLAVALGTQAAEREPGGAAALFGGGLRALHRDHGPGLARAPGVGSDRELLVRRGLVVVGLAFFPAVARRLRLRDAERAIETGRNAAQPAAAARVGVLGVDVHDRDLEVFLGGASTTMFAPVRVRQPAGTVNVTPPGVACPGVSFSNVTSFAAAGASARQGAAVTSAAMATSHQVERRFMAIPSSRGRAPSVPHTEVATPVPVVR